MTLDWQSTTNWDITDNYIHSSDGNTDNYTVTHTDSTIGTATGYQVFHDRYNNALLIANTARLYDIGEYTLTSETEFTNTPTKWYDDSHSYNSKEFVDSNYRYYGTITGSNNDDVIDGLSEWTQVSDSTTTTYSGDDIPGHIIKGRQGSDTINGGPGSDSISGGADSDSLNGGDGDDVILGGADDSADIISGGDGADSVDGGGGDDIIYVGLPTDDDAGDYIIGGDGADTFFLGDSDSTSATIEGTPFDWSSFGYTVAQSTAASIFTLSASTVTSSVTKLGILMAKDFVPLVVSAFKGSSQVTPDQTVVDTPSNIEEGEYVQVADFNPTEDVVVIPINGTTSNVNYEIADNGTLQLQYLNTGQTFAQIELEDLSTILNNSDIGTSTATEQLIWESVLSSGTSLDQTTGTASLGVGSNSIELDGVDDVTGLDISYIVIGAQGAGSILGTSVADATKLYGTNYNDTIVAFPTTEVGSSDIPDDSNGDDELYGFDGDDILAAGGGNDLYYGGLGTDLVSYYTESNDALSGGIIVDLSTTADFGDSAAYIDPSSGTTYTAVTDTYGDSDKLFSIEGIEATDYDDTLVGNDEDNLFITHDGIDTVFGDAGNDTIYGGDDSDFLLGGDDNDSLYGYGGDDGIYGMSGSNYIDGGYGEDTIGGADDGNDTLIGGGNTDLIYGYGGNDELYGNWGYDTLYGGEGNDYIQAGSKDDVIYGGEGYDTLAGNGGADRFILNGNTRTDTILDFDGAEGDTIEISQSVYGISSLDDLYTVSSGAGDILSANGIQIILFDTSSNDFSIEDHVTLI